MRIASWNVNSIRPRMEQLTSWLVRARPDVVCLQETKVEDDKFPEAEIGDAGYRAVFFGQRTYNGVAILTRFGVTVDKVKKNLDGDADDAHRRAIAATIDGIRVVNVYVPNGQEITAPAYQYKLEWLSRLKQELVPFAAAGDPLIACGDFNVAPEPIDVHNTKKWDKTVLFHDEIRAKLRDVMSIGLADSFRVKHPDAKEMDAYERLLGDAMRGDATLFAREDYVEEAWRIVDPVLASPPTVQVYEPGTWGPAEAMKQFGPPGGWPASVVDSK